MYDVIKDYVIKFEKGADVVSHTLRQPTVEDIHLFEIKKTKPMKMKEGEITQDNINAIAYVYLWDLLVKSVDGYNFQGKNWKDKVPALDKIRVAKVFGNVIVIDEKDVVTDFGKEFLIESKDDEVIIYLTAKQDGEKKLLTHFFSQPSIENISEFESINSFSKIKPKKNKVLISSSPTTKRFCDLYDSVIREVKGYVSEGKTDLPDVRDKLPAVHKVQAIKELFSILTEELEEISGN